MKKYLTWFVNNSSRKWIIEAKNRKEALVKFAQSQCCEVSGYMQARPLRDKDLKGDIRSFQVW